MDLVHDILDTRLVDRNGQGLGRVDDVLLQLRESRPPAFVAMEAGAVTLARRVHPRVARIVSWIARSVSPVPLRTVRYSPRLFRDIGVDIELDVAASRDPRLLRFERWLSRHVVARLPGGKA